MTALAGILSFEGRTDLLVYVSQMLDAQVTYGPEERSTCIHGSVAMGRGLFSLLPEDRFDLQPLSDAGQSVMLVADVRLDNREWLLDSLGLPRHAEISDSKLVFLGYRKWGDQLPNRLIGDFAYAVWDERQQILTLARDPVGQRPLHFHIGDGFVAFASMPQGLHTLPNVGRAIDLRQLALFVADIPKAGSATFFKGIGRVQPGHLLKISRRGAQAQPYWQAPTRETRFRKRSDYVEALREQLELATKCRLRGSGPIVGAHLSAGLDSSSVASTAAKLLAPHGKVLAFTAAPREGFDGPLPRERIADESRLASEVVARHPNMEHIVLRTGNLSPLDFLKSGPALYEEPVGHPCNHVWWSAINEAASARGVSVLLTGEAGNLTISAGSVAILSDFVRTGRLIRWSQEAYRLNAAGLRWRRLLATSFGPWLPRMAWVALSRRASGPSGVAGADLLAAELRTDLQGRLKSESRIDRPSRDERSVRWRLLQDFDPGAFRKGALARWGVDERDPTADRRLIEFCFSIPSEILLCNGVPRQLAKFAFADRLPESVLNAPRGYQYADWYEALQRQALERVSREIERDGTASALLDFERLGRLLAAWPAGDWGSMSTIGTYRVSLLKALSAGLFAAYAGK